MNAQQFVWWLTGFMECVEIQDARLICVKEWDTIKSTLQSVTCWEIEQGTELK